MDILGFLFFLFTVAQMLERVPVHTLEPASAWGIVENTPNVPWYRKDLKPSKDGVYWFIAYSHVLHLNAYNLYAFPIVTLLYVHVFLQAGESGSADTVRDPRGFAMKFYTEEGNWDLVGNNTPIFFIRDALLVSEHQRWGYLWKRPRVCSRFVLASEAKGVHSLDF